MPELGGDQRRGAGRPVHPGVAGLAGEPEHQRLGAGAVDQLALQLLELQPPLLRLQHLVGGLRLQEGGAAAGGRRQPVLAQRVADRRDRRVRHRLQLRRRRCRRQARAPLLRRVGRGGAPGVGGVRRRSSRRGAAPAARRPSPSGSPRARGRRGRRSRARSCPASRPRKSNVMIHLSTWIVRGSEHVWWQADA